VLNSLEDATKALREQYDGKPQGNEQFTRTRVLAELREQQRRAKARGPFVIPILVLLLGSAAWAASSGRFVAVLEKASEVVAAVREGEGASNIRGRARHAMNPGAQPKSSAVSAPEISPSVVSEPTSKGAEPASAGGRIEAKSARPVALALADDAATAREFELYEAAHRAHFVEKNAAAALAAWTRYLDETHAGRFALEAKYNRALSLLRLGRTAEGSSELSSFATGKHGTYRQAEARRLIDGLGGGESRGSVAE
jgi:hypothetical protein